MRPPQTEPTVHFGPKYACTDIHEQKMAREALQRSEEALQQAGRRKDEFLAMLAHELRNPLAPIRTAATLLGMAPGDPQRVTTASGIIERQVTHLTQLVDDLLDVSRVTRGLVTLDLVTLDLKQALLAAMEQARPLIEARNHTLAMHLPHHALWVKGDLTRLTQIAANLLNNAAKYTPMGGQVTLEAGQQDDSVWISVRDNGCGMAASLLPHVFDLFIQGEQQADRAQGGLGIGLALVRSLVQLHGGTVTAASEGLGQGSCFTVTLPRERQRLSPTLQQESASVGSPHRSKRVVVVEDNRDAAQTLAFLLETVGYRVDTFGTAEEALKADLSDVDVYVLDIGLPGMTGLEMVPLLKKRIGERRVQLFALSGYGQPQDRDRSLAAGFDRHFVKPVEVSALLEALSQE